MSYLSEVLADGPSLYWRLGESSGTTAADSSGNGRAGEYRATPTLGVAGGLTGSADKAVELDGKEEYVRIPAYTPFVAGSTRTFEGWAWRDVSTAEHTLVGSSNGGSEPCLKLESGNQNVIWSADSTGTLATWAAAWPGNAQWVHWALVFDETANQASLYINGALVSTKEHTTNYNTPGYLFLGARNGGTAFWDGRLDEFAVYEKALSAARIKVHYEVGLTGSTIEGKGSGTGTGSGAAAGTRTRMGKGSGAGTGASSAQGTRTRMGQGAGSGGGSGVAAGTRTRLAKGEGSGTGSGSASGEASVPVYPRVAVGQEHPPDRMAIRISDPKTGRTIARLADDEADLSNVIDSIGYESEMQGGSKSLKGNLARDPRVPWSDLPAYADVTVYSDGVEELWWGRIEKLDGAEVDRTGLDLEAVGHIAALEDDKACLGLGFIDADQTKWGEPSVERRKLLAEANIPLVANTSFGFGSMENESEPPAVLNDFSGVAAGSGKSEAGEADYDSGGVDIDQVLYDYRALAVPDASFDSTMSLGTTDTFSTAVAGTDHNGTTALQQQVSATGAGYRFARLQDKFGGAFEGQMTNLFAWQYLRVLAQTGLALQGTWPNVGYTAKQMLGYAVPRYSYLEARDEDLEDDGFIIPHAWFSEPGILADVVKELTKFGLLDWFIYEGKRLQLRYPGTYGRFWQAAPGPAELKETGLDANRLWREIVVAFQDVDGSTKYVGPPGSGAHIEDPSLEVTDPDHPAVRAEITRKDLLVMKGVGNVPTAIKIGVNWLEAANELSHAGECALSDYVMSDKGIWYPSSYVKAGDHVRFPGRDSSYRKVTHADYQRLERKASCSLDAPPDGLEALQERFQVELHAAGLAS